MILIHIKQFRYNISRWVDVDQLILKNKTPAYY